MSIQTPYQKAGYKPGDRFVVVVENIFRKGSIVELHEDDGTRIPSWKLIDGYCIFDWPAPITAYEFLHYMQLMEEEIYDN